MNGMILSFFLIDINLVDLVADRAWPKLIFHDDPLTEMLESSIPLENDGLNI